MPQMAPLPWLTLMILFSTLIMTMMFILYFNFTLKMSSSSMKYSKPNQKWTW